MYNDPTKYGHIEPTRQAGTTPYPYYDVPPIPPPPPPKRRPWLTVVAVVSSIVLFIAFVLGSLLIASHQEQSMLSTTPTLAPTMPGIPTPTQAPTVIVETPTQAPAAQPTQIPTSAPTIETTVIVVLPTVAAPLPTPTAIPPTPTALPTPTDTPTAATAPYTAEEIQKAFYQAGIQMGQPYWNNNWSGWSYTPEGGAIYWTDLASGYTVEIATFASPTEAYADAQQVGQGYASQTVNDCLFLSDNRMTNQQLASYEQVLQANCT